MKNETITVINTESEQSVVVNVRFQYGGDSLLPSVSGQSARDTKEDGTANEFDSIWRRFINKALSETKLQERFTEHDLRAKVASDIESEHARQLLGHSNSEITERTYRRKAAVVKPFK